MILYLGLKTSWNLLTDLVSCAFPRTWLNVPSAWRRDRRRLESCTESAALCGMWFSFGSVLIKNVAIHLIDIHFSKIARCFTYLLDGFDRHESNPNRRIIVAIIVIFMVVLACISFFYRISYVSGKNNHLLSIIALNEVEHVLLQLVSLGSFGRREESQTFYKCCWTLAQRFPNCIYDIMITPYIH